MAQRADIRIRVRTLLDSTAVPREIWTYRFDRRAYLLAALAVLALSIYALLSG